MLHEEKPQNPDESRNGIGVEEQWLHWLWSQVKKVVDSLFP